MKIDIITAQTPATAKEATGRREWHPPVIDDADISALTNGSGTSGVEGSSFLKTGS